MHLSDSTHRPLLRLLVFVGAALFVAVSCAVLLLVSERLEELYARLYGFLD